MEYIIIPEINPKAYGYANKLNQNIFGRPQKNPHPGLIKSKERVGRKYRHVTKIEMNHTIDVEDYILPSMYKKTRNWSDCGAWKSKIY